MLRILTRLFTGSSQDLPSHESLIADLYKRVKQLDNALADATGEIDKWASEHRKLRGRFYAARGELDPSTNQPKEPATREERRREAMQRFGFVPGKAPPHAGA
jgi:hypothetical protein